MFYDTPEAFDSNNRITKHLFFVFSVIWKQTYVTSSFISKKCYCTLIQADLWFIDGLGKCLLELATTNKYESFKLSWNSDRLLSVVGPSVRLSINFSYFHLLPQNHQAISTNLAQDILGDWNSRLFKWSAPPFFKGRYYEIAKIHVWIIM